MAIHNPQIAVLVDSPHTGQPEGKNRQEAYPRGTPKSDHSSPPIRAIEPSSADATACTARTEY